MGFSSAEERHHEYVRRNKFPTPVDNGVVEADWEKRGFSVSTMSQRAGATLSRSVEDKDELLTVAEGHLECYVGENRQYLLVHPGDELFLPRFQPFEATVPPQLCKKCIFLIGFE